MRTSDHLRGFLAHPSCPPADLLAAYFENRLSPNLKAEIGLHLQDCPACAGLQPRSKRRHRGHLLLAATLLLAIGSLAVFRGIPAPSTNSSQWPAKASPHHPLSLKFRGHPGRAYLLQPSGIIHSTRPIFVSGPFAPIRIEIFPLSPSGIPSLQSYRFRIQKPKSTLPFPKRFPDLVPGSYLCLVEGKGLVPSQQTFRIELKKKALKTKGKEGHEK